jgi:hypothetical protein
MILVEDGQVATLSVPEHREIAKGTLRSLIRSSGLSVEQFVALAGKQADDATSVLFVSCSSCVKCSVVLCELILVF